MKRTIAYIDGYNLYYGLLKGTPSKWLDLEALVRALLREGHDLLSVKYFTAPVKTYPHDMAALERQNAYLQALSTRPKVKVIQGYYSKNQTLLPAYEERCRQCDVPRNGFVRVVKIEEKQSDVNIACEMLRDAYSDAADALVLVSGDTDFITPVNIVRKELKRTVIVLNPRSRRSDLERVASYYRDIPRDLPARCQLPDAIPIGTHGNFIRCPSAWKQEKKAALA